MANDHRQALNGAEVFIRALENEGVKYIFAVPGEENLAFLEALRNSSIRLVLNRHEQAAGFMAATYGRLTGKTGVCMSTLGPGATNFVTAAAYAQLGAMPLLMVTGQKPIKTSKQGQFQIIDVVEMMQPISKYTHQIVSGQNIPSKVREAIRIAEEERPGAVHLELPEDVAAEDVDTPLFPKDRVRRPVAEKAGFVMTPKPVGCTASRVLPPERSNTRREFAGVSLRPVPASAATIAKTIWRTPPASHPPPYFSRRFSNAGGSLTPP